MTSVVLVFTASAAGNRAEHLDRPSASLQSSPACFAVSLWSPLAISQVCVSRGTFTETPLFEVCTAKIGPCHCPPPAPLPALRSSPLHSDLNVECIVTATGRPWNSSYSKCSVHLSDSGILLMFAERVLIAVPCSVTTTPSDDEFSITNLPGWNRAVVP